MGGISSRIALGLAAVVAAFFVLAGTAYAGAVIQTDPVEYTFLPGPYVQGLGETATLDNSVSENWHDVVATKKGPDGKPLFSTPLARGGETKVVQGTQYLAAGTYHFICSFHGAGMSGDLTIDGSSGSASPRPSVKLTFPAQSLKQVRKSGVKVKIKATTASKKVKVTAKAGKVTLGTSRALDFTAGQSKTVNLPLTKAGRKAIARPKSVQIKLSAAVPYGKSASASRKVK